MEIRINTDNEVVLNVNNDDSEDEVMRIVNAIRNGNLPKPVDTVQELVTKARSETRKQSVSPATGDSKLNQIQYRTWEYLAQNDCPGGIHVSQVAHAFGITNAAANTRLLVLYGMGYAQRVAKGYYRALTPAE